jgi:hypothetical protein
MVQRCVVCFSLGSRGFFSFPKDPVRRQLWLDHCGLSRDYQLKISHCVCYLHFKPEDMKSNNKNISLLKSAIPSKMVINSVELSQRTIGAPDCASKAPILTTTTSTPPSCPHQVVVIGPRRIPFHVNHIGVLFNFVIEDNKTINDLIHEVKRLTGCSKTFTFATDYPGSTSLQVLQLPSDNRLYLSCQPGQCHSDAVPATSSPIQQPSFEVCNFFEFRFLTDKIHSRP